MNPQEHTNGVVQPPVEIAAPAPEPLVYYLSPAERAIMLRLTETLVRTESAMQGAMQLILEQQGLASPKGFRLEKDCSAIVEQR